MATANNSSLSISLSFVAVSLKNRPSLYFTCCYNCCCIKFLLIVLDVFIFIVFERVTYLHGACLTPQQFLSVLANANKSIKKILKNFQFAEIHLFDNILVTPWWRAITILAPDIWHENVNTRTWSQRYNVSRNNIFRHAKKWNYKIQDPTPDTKYDAALYFSDYYLYNATQHACYVHSYIGRSE